MEYRKYKEGVLLRQNDFNIAETLECGQCFRFKRDANCYLLIAHARKLNIIQNENEFYFSPCTLQEFEDIWINYFDLETDYAKIKSQLSLEYVNNIRILKQEPFECLMSFIISQNNRITQIQRVIENISCKYGTEIEKDIYAFPTPTQLQKATCDELMECKAGFRAKYIRDALDKLKTEIDLEKLQSESTKTIRDTLMQIKGVGLKVSDCILLFAFNRTEVYPVDVWVKRITEELYFDGKSMSVNDIRAFGENTFGDLAGYAQQFLFHYARNVRVIN